MRLPCAKPARLNSLGRSARLKPLMSGSPAADPRALRIAKAVNRGRRGKIVETYAPAKADLLSAEQRRAWEQDGFFLLRGAVETETCAEIDADVIRRVRHMAEHGKPVDGLRVTGGSFSIPEENFRHQVDEPEDKISKLYNLHREDLFRHLARNPALATVAAGILGPDVDIFNSQYIFKNPGAWGQPWHQDSLYFMFDRFPQVGVWLATSEATVENGCLFVLPGSHREPVHEHLADSRPDANLGYLEIRDHDFTGEVPVLMQPGDVLVFHSFLMHRSADNTSDDRRTAVVYHYGPMGTRHQGMPSPTVDWMPVVRGGEPVPVGTHNPWHGWRPRLQLRIGTWLHRLQQLFGRSRS